MNIRDGFVTNSSSTSYIILSKTELTGEYLAGKLGITKKSPNYNEMLGICEEFVSCAKDGFYHHYYQDTNEKLVNELFGEETAEKYRKLLEKNYKLYCGKFSSDNTNFESALCVDCFKIEDKDFFMDSSVCGW